MNLPQGAAAARISNEVQGTLVSKAFPIKQTPHVLFWMAGITLGWSLTSTSDSTAPSYVLGQEESEWSALLLHMQAWHGEITMTLQYIAHI